MEVWNFQKGSVGKHFKDDIEVANKVEYLKPGLAAADLVHHQWSK